MIPAILITGFLGAGKTTLLNLLIQFYSKKRTVVLVNEFGSVNIDSAILVKGGFDKVELNRGSLFCVCIRKDMLKAFTDIAEHMQPELLIIEATGLADTSEMEAIMALPSVKDTIRLQACICLVDAVNFFKIKDNLRVPATQVCSADLILINKTDLADASRVNETIEAVRSIAEGAQIIQTVYGAFPFEVLEQISRDTVGSDRPPGEGRPDAFQTATLEGEGNLSRQAWESLKNAFSSDIQRIKGFLTIENNPFFVEAPGRNHIDHRAPWQAARNLPFQSNIQIFAGFGPAQRAR